MCRRRVINGDGAVNGDTRARVLATIRDLDYVPSAVARGLSRRRTQTLGLMTTDFAEYVVGQAVGGRPRPSDRAICW